MAFSYAVLGAGRQGTASAYDLGRWGDASRVVLADQHLHIAQEAANRVNELLGLTIAHPAAIDVTKENDLVDLLDEVDAVLSAVPYHLNLSIATAAVKSRTHLCDLGGNIDVAREQHLLDDDAQAAGVSIVPNCGQVPGMGTSLMVHAMGMRDELLAREVFDTLLEAKVLVERWRRHCNTVRPYTVGGMLGPGGHCS